MAARRGADSARRSSVAAVATTLTCGSLTRPAPPSVVRMTVTTSGSTALTLSGADRDVAITPDGSRVVYRGNNQLLVRALNQLEPDVLSGLGAPRGVFISPDGQWVGFFDGSPTQESGDHGWAASDRVRRPRHPRGATWSEDGTIIFATSTTGDRPAARVRGRRRAHRAHEARSRARGRRSLWPEFLPGGEAVLFTITPADGGIENAQIAVLDLQTGTSKVLIRGGSHAHYVPTGHLVYGVTGTLRAVAFDLGRLEVVRDACAGARGRGDDRTGRR